MRRSPIIDVLFPGVRGSILIATILRPEKEWYLSELASYLNVRPSSLQREVVALSKAGLLEERRDGRRLYLRPDMRSPVLFDLKRLFEKTAGIVMVLLDLLDPLGDKIRFAFVYGSVARSNETSESDIDLMLIGEVQLFELVPYLREAERMLGRLVNATVYSTEEFIRKSECKDHFLCGVLESANLFVKGDADELRAITCQGRSQGSSKQQAGTR